MPCLPLVAHTLYPPPPNESVGVLPPEGTSHLCYPKEEHLWLGREDRSSAAEPELDPAPDSRAAATIQP